MAQPRAQRMEDEERSSQLAAKMARGWRHHDDLGPMGCVRMKRVEVHYKATLELSECPQGAEARNKRDPDHGRREAKGRLATRDVGGP